VTGQDELDKSMTYLKIENLSKNYGALAVVDDVSMDVARGEFLTLLGPSGSGKTTLLMMLAGFIRPSSGSIQINDRQLVGLPPEKRNFGLVLQGYALFPHMTVAENVGFSLKIRGRSKAEVEQAVRRSLDTVQLSHLWDRFPKQLSGGQQQRVAIARAIIFQPDLLLLDEPLSALDKKLRMEVQSELRDLNRRLEMTFICVTHDQEEALSLSDTVAILKSGRIEQVDTPRGLYTKPQSRFIAEFLGRSNFLKGEVIGSNRDGVSYRLGNTILHQEGSGLPEHGSITISIRPEEFKLSTSEDNLPQNRLRAVVKGLSYAGADCYIELALPDGGRVTVRTEATRNLASEQEAWIGWSPNDGVRVSDV
jgi:putative spermidine/putrescine transport system ATP-binding protein